MNEITVLGVQASVYDLSAHLYKPTSPLHMYVFFMV